MESYLSEYNLEQLVTKYLRSQFDYSPDVSKVPAVSHGYDYKHGIYIASHAKLGDIPFAVQELVYMKTQDVADKMGMTRTAAKKLQRYCQFDMPISFCTYLRIVKRFAPEVLEYFFNIPEGLVVKL